ncbi:Type IV prepilin peptidase TadV/CpaA [Yersinia pseudotuberculosis]|uniref:A24 family peptidase n=1 Tax=Yersinia pseudotuberculosis TaxID=633 RepID=UPI0004F88CE0|nr:prepilin peptidase [Yersinia pseudotuberculosis]AIN16030.1 type IV leader peptidase family protein [Yersinia pseudotuberculosis]AJJ08695.1 type IV leader peptidase family protein [Yersinia pseudotuberculosis]MBO1551747.1 tight adherance operon protein [Yersinia pseudotuberculosis]MBO1554527.1 tight adherance operon protein [Yersinia pseudotuberculosis]MBO1562316.1 tight adherance operon protein [Yersinia pseudotuberculosis]
MDVIRLSLMVLIVSQLLFVCYSDIRHRIISNKFVISIACNAIILSLVTHHTVSIIIPIVALFIGYIIFHFNVMGGGDVKLITALLLALTAEQSLNFIIYTAVMGGVVMVVGLLINRADIQKRGVPYAVAITAGFLSSVLI